MTVGWNPQNCATVFAVWIKQVPDLLFSYLRLTFSGVFLLLFLRSHYLSAG
ncbi:membrane protein [Escherichia coli O157:H7 str. K2845]|nr:membrane protein [Escherichia coli O157:H7 str. K2845]